MRGSIPSPLWGGLGWGALFAKNSYAISLLLREEIEGGGTRLGTDRDRSSRHKARKVAATEYDGRRAQTLV
ncbi:hypothetical protein MESS2_650072 [Mesorhizobium metallidurans STM 2683]|uniref:Uncharacterized protein n=1 Tax=Mesorhizobium metallidurans STM 2683 TaxID=1297569 RepID=M5EUG7_9HYPH|nr:hypothetical protein MESS2_650072 [Mesorhizobium metallidurans STM 2683]